ncbi:MAG: M1 family metallopeptidase [Bacteroidales bacterium]
MRISILLLLPLLVLLNSCAALMGIHDFGEVPKKPGKYPAFREKDYLVGTLDEDRASYDVTYYDLNISIDPAKKLIGGDVSIYFRILTATDNMRIDLYRNLDIASIKLNGKELAFTRKDRAVYISLGQMMVTGDIGILNVRYSGKPVVARNPPWIGGMVWKEDKGKRPWIGVTCQTEGGSIWFPCKDHISDEPDSVRTTITVPTGLSVVSNGVLKGHVSNGATDTFTWATSYPINIYNITFYAGTFTEFSDTVNTKHGTVKLNYTVLDYNLEKAKTHFLQTKKVIKIYSELFGPYPWVNEGFRLVEAPYEGMEHQTAIAYGSGFQDYSFLGGDYIIVHEAAHEWWGNAVTVDDFSDIWLQEGFATYSEVLFVEKTLGYERSLRYAQYWLGSMINNKRPVVGPRDVSYWDHKDNDVYMKGAMILHTIRNAVGDSTIFFNILQTFYKEHAAGTHVTTDDFVEVVERMTGSEWDKFFEAYLYTRQIPVLKWFFGIYKPDPMKESLGRTSVPFVVAKWENVPDGFVMPVTINSYTAGKIRKESSRIYVTTKAQVFFMENLNEADQVSCNAKSSYFRPELSKDILKELEQ